MEHVVYSSTVDNRRVTLRGLVSARLDPFPPFPVLFVLLHIPLGVVLYNVGLFGLLHPIAAFVFGMRAAIRRDWGLDRAGYFAAYITGSEIIWRMADVPIFWEFGKYGAAVILVTALVRRKMWNIPPFAAIYIALLIPGALITLTQYSLSESRQMLSSIMSGPFLLSISCWYFSNLEVDWKQVRKYMMAMVVPLVSAAAATVVYTVTASDIQFNGESNFATSGGFGPNQVSSMLGLGAFLCLASLLLFKNSRWYMIYLGIATILFSAQSVLTFSRGGMYNAIGAILLIIIFQLADLRSGIRRLIPVAGLSLVFLLFVFPYLNDFTGGALQERFEDTEPTKRAEIVEADLKIFATYPVVGIGVGNAYAERAKYMDEKAMSHTEFTRLLAEHGVFGLLALATFVLIIVYNFRKQNTTLGRAFVAGLTGWSMLFMSNAGMRLVAPSFIFGMIYLTIVTLRLPRPQTPFSKFVSAARM